MPHFTWNKSQQLRRISQVPDPDFAKRRGGHEVLALVLFRQQASEPLKPIKRERIAADFIDEPGADLVFVAQDHAAAVCSERALTSNTASAAGVTPRTRAAAPKVPGRAADKRSAISLESPGIAA